ncbi:unnamed protein product, partial [Staurois parvus]
CSQARTILQATTKPSTRPLNCQAEKRDSSLRRTCLRCSRVQWWHGWQLLFPVASTLL